ncbi:MAG: hypothetical protein J7515_02700 [Caulobacter sp.]|nr:hypothetical protein [Caulobacter sp.]
MTDFTIKTSAPAKTRAKRAKEAVDKAVETVSEKAHVAAELAAEKAGIARSYAAEKAEIGKAWSIEKAKAAHVIAEERPVAVAIGAFVAGAVFGFLLARNFDR